ncbi:MAG: ERCC4 domain-containing protein [Candidatus Hydrothermarchaeales archaeon]
MLLDEFMSDKPVVVYDANESRTHVVRALKKFGDITVVKRNLEIADYLVQAEDGTIAVERKRATDFLSSISDGRLFTQLEHLQEYGDARIILEGAIFTSVKSGRCYSIDTLGKVLSRGKRSARSQPRTMWSTQFFVHPHALSSIFKKIQDSGIVIIPSGSAYDTAELLRHWATKGEKANHLMIRRKSKVQTEYEKQLFLLCGLPGINTKRAEELLKHFGTPMNVLKAFFQHPPNNFPLEGIGPKTVKNVRRLMKNPLAEAETKRIKEHEFREGVDELRGILRKKEDELKGKSIPELKAILKEKGLKLAGKKDELVIRILESIPDDKKVDIHLFLKRYNELSKIKTEFQNIPEDIEKKYKIYKKKVL